MDVTFMGLAPHAKKFRYMIRLRYFDPDEILEFLHRNFGKHGDQYITWGLNKNTEGWEKRMEWFKHHDANLYFLSEDAFMVFKLVFTEAKYSIIDNLDEDSAFSRVWLYG